MSLPAEWAPIARAADALLEDMDAVAAEVAKAIRSTVPEYVYVTDDELRRTVHRNLSAIVACLRDKRQLTQVELRDFELTVEERARVGVPLDEYLLAIATSDAVIWDLLQQRLTPPAPADVLLKAFAIRHTYINTITRVTAAVHRRVELALSQEQHERRALALRALMRGGLSEDMLRDHASRLGLDVDRPYFVVMARGGPDAGSEQVQRQITAGPSHPPDAALVLWGDDVVGLVLALPPRVEGLSGGVAGPTTLDQLPEAHRQANLALRTAMALGLEGLYSTDDLGVRVAVKELPSIGQALRRKYLDPVLDAGSLGRDLLTTVETYLLTGSRRDETAAALHLHGNTVAYRIRRFGELTGADLTNVATLVELWWLFTDLRLNDDP
ncbi:MAG: hypothetical protein JWO12_1974 [Frankiales bacterium]|nr:hypothetical protein [Frankiales bacterium]